MSRVSRMAWGALFALLGTTAGTGCAPHSTPLAAPNTPTPESTATSTPVYNVGLPTDMPGWGKLDLPDKRTGFEYDLMEWLAARMHFNAQPIDEKLGSRISDVQNGNVKITLANLSMTNDRAQQVTFAGPYMKTQQSVMVRQSDNRLRKLDDLVNKSICTISGTTSSDQLEAEFPHSRFQEATGLQECVDDLTKGSVDAVSADQLDLLGFAEQSASPLKVLPLVFGHQEMYGIGLRHGDTTTCQQFTDALRQFLSSAEWQSFFSTYFPDEPPASHKPALSDLVACT